MNLKQKNLEPFKGNSFASLHSDALNQLARDSNLYLGADSLESDTIVNKLMVEENKKVVKKGTSKTKSRITSKSINERRSLEY
jgi:hypothetical protein